MSACAVLQQPTSLIDQTNRLETFRLTGRLSLQYVNTVTGRTEQFYGRFDWLEHASVIDLRLTDPLGQTVAAITAQAMQTTLTLANGQTYRGTTPEDLSLQTLGWPLPLTGLKQWLRVQAASQAAMQRDLQGRIINIDQSGWSIAYMYVDDSPASLVQRIELNYPANHQQSDVQVVLKLIPDRQ